MPLNPPALAAGFLTPQLAATGNIGQAVPQLSLGVAIGVTQFLTTATVTSVDAGALGVGTTVFPLIVPPPLLQVELLTALTAANLLGQLAPLFLQGLTFGLTTGWTALALHNIQHPTVGTGTAVAKIIAPPGGPLMVQGFAAAGMTGDGPSRMAIAIGSALDATFAKFVQAGLPIVGSAAPAGSSGVGVGKIL